jgi:hypothetical protein
VGVIERDGRRPVAQKSLRSCERAAPRVRAISVGNLSRDGALAAYNESDPISVRDIWTSSRFRGVHLTSLSV